MKKNEQKTVLVVDDVVENIDILNNLLNKHYKVKAARSGKKALEIVKMKPAPDLILLDIMMPEMDGYEVIQHLKKDPKTASIPVIFVSAKNETFDQTRAFSLGAADYITKPIAPEVTIARVNTHIALHEKEKHLKARVKKEVSKRIEQEKLLLRQSRLAAMGEMMSVITHQWNQPLSVIGMVSTSLKVSAELDEITNEEVVNQLKVIDDNLSFMSQTMVDFKNYFRPDKYKKSFKINDEVENVASMLKPMLKRHNIKLEISIKDDITGYGTESEFKQVILNLISNAKDAINKNKKDESIEAFIKIDAKCDGKISVLKVSDNGGGIPDESIDKIFDNYYTTKGDKGTGIGLAMSKMIIEDQMDGTITVKNKDDGAQFILTFPAVKSDKDE